MGNTAHGLPWPEGTSPLMDGDDAIHALADAVEGALWSSASAPEPGVWVDCTANVYICSDTGATHPGSTISRAKYMQIGSTVFYQGEGGIGTTQVAAACVLLPNSMTGVPVDRVYNCGTFRCTKGGSGAPATQNGCGFMSAAKDRIIIVADTNAYLAGPSGAALRWNVQYEVAPLAAATKPRV